MYAKAKSSAFTEDKAPIATHEAWLVVVNLDWAGKRREKVSYPWLLRDFRVTQIIFCSSTEKCLAQTVITTTQY